MHKITIDEFCNQWARTKQQMSWSSRLSYNVEEFTTRAGVYSLSRFKTSFYEGGMYGSGTKWKPRESKWGKKFTHPVMRDQGILKGSLKGGRGKYGQYSSIGKMGYKRNYSYDISTTERSRPIKGKRGRKKRGNQTYAAVHNTDPKFGLYTVNQYSSRRPEQRQFIGHSDKLQNTIEELFIPLIFKNFPGLK